MVKSSISLHMIDLYNLFHAVKDKNKESKRKSGKKRRKRWFQTKPCSEVSPLNPMQEYFDSGKALGEKVTLK